MTKALMINPADMRARHVLEFKPIPVNQYDRSVTEEEKTYAEKVEFEKDDLYDEAARIVVSTGQASISYLQRRLRIGFSRAARLMEWWASEQTYMTGCPGSPRTPSVR